MVVMMGVQEALRFRGLSTQQAFMRVLDRSEWR